MANRTRAGRSAGRKRRGGGGIDPGASLQFSGVNFALGGAALVTLVLGYWLLSNGSVSAAPLLLVLGYVVLVPLAILL